MTAEAIVVSVTPMMYTKHTHRSFASRIRRIVAAEAVTILHQ